MEKQHCQLHLNGALTQNSEKPCPSCADEYRSILWRTFPIDFRHLKVWCLRWAQQAEIDIVRWLIFLIQKDPLLQISHQQINQS